MLLSLITICEENIVTSYDVSIEWTDAILIKDLFILAKLNSLFMVCINSNRRRKSSDLEPLFSQHSIFFKMKDFSSN